MCLLSGPPVALAPSMLTGGRERRRPGCTVGPVHCADGWMDCGNAVEPDGHVADEWEPVTGPMYLSVRAFGCTFGCTLTRLFG